MAARIIDLAPFPKTAKLLGTTFLHANPVYNAQDRIYKILNKYYDLRYSIYPDSERNGSIILSIAYTLDEEIQFRTNHRSYEEATLALYTRLTKFIEQLEQELIVT